MVRDTGASKRRQTIVPDDVAAYLGLPVRWAEGGHWWRILGAYVVFVAIIWTCTYIGWVNHWPIGINGRVIEEFSWITYAPPVIIGFGVWVFDIVRQRHVAVDKWGVRASRWRSVITLYTWPEILDAVLVRRPTRSGKGYAVDLVLQTTGGNRKLATSIRGLVEESDPNLEALVKVIQRVLDYLHGEKPTVPEDESRLDPGIGI